MTEGRTIDMVERDQFREAMSRLGAAVNIVTTDGAAGRYGITVSAVCSVTDDPPTVLVCVNRNSVMNKQIKANGVLCINVLGNGHADLSNRFANKKFTAGERFADERQWRQIKTGAPVLKDATVVLDCTVADTQEVGTHTVFYAAVHAIQLGDQLESLVYFNRAYHSLVGRQDVKVERAPDLFAMINGGDAAWI